MRSPGLRRSALAQTRENAATARARRDPGRGGRWFGARVASPWSVPSLVPRRPRRRRRPRCGRSPGSSGTPRAGAQGAAHWQIRQGAAGRPFVRREARSERRGARSEKSSSSLLTPVRSLLSQTACNARAPCRSLRGQSRIPMPAGPVSRPVSERRSPAAPPQAVPVPGPSWPSGAGAPQAIFPAVPARKRFLV